MIPKKVYISLISTTVARNFLLLEKRIEALRSSATVPVIPVRVNAVVETITNPLQLCMDSTVFWWDQYGEL